MSAQEQRVWAAIEQQLRAHGDTDIQAGLGWLSDDQKQAVAQAAILAAK